MKVMSVMVQTYLNGYGVPGGSEYLPGADILKTAALDSAEITPVHVMQPIMAATVMPRRVGCTRCMYPVLLYITRSENT